jgi:hypothetical protein
VTEFLDINGGRIAYDVTGDGPLVVLSHGMGSTAGCTGPGPGTGAG